MLLIYLNKYIIISRIKIIILSEQKRGILMKENRETISSMTGERIRRFRTEQKLSQEEDVMTMLKKFNKQLFNSSIFEALEIKSSK